MNDLVKRADGSLVLSPGGAVRYKRDAAAVNNADWGDTALTMLPVEGTSQFTVSIDITEVPAGVVGAVLDLISPSGWRESFPLDPLEVGELALGQTVAVETGVRAYIRTFDASDRMGYSAPAGIPMAAAHAAPGEVLFTAETGAAAGEILITVIAPLPDGGDGNTVGDGLGEPDFVDVSVNGGLPVELGDGDLVEGEYVLGGLNPGATYSIQLRARSAFRAGELSDPQTATAEEEDDPVGTFPTDLGTLTPQEIESGSDFTIDLATHITGADSYTVSGIDGGGLVGSVYTANDVPAGTYTLTILACNGANCINASLSVTAYTPAVAPSWTQSVLPAQVVNTGGTIDLDLSTYLRGTEPITLSISSSADNIGLVGRHLKNTAALSSAVATHTRTIIASNAQGSASATVSIGVIVERPAKLVTGTDVTIVRAVETFPGWRKPVITFPSGRDVQAGQVVVPLWSTRTPDANGNIDLQFVERLVQTSVSPREWQTEMDDPQARGNPTVQQAEVSLGANPLATQAGSPVITVTKAAHGLGSARRSVAITGATAVGGLTVEGRTAVHTPIGPNIFSITEDANATTTVAAGGGSVAKYTANRADYSMYAPSDPAASSLRFALSVGGVVGYWSDPFTVPDIVTPPTGIGRIWLQNSRRLPGSYDAVPPWIGAEGKQFQHSFCTNRRATRDPSKADWAFMTQDENGMTFTPDGRVFTAVKGVGLYGSSGCAVYYCSDDLTSGLLMTIMGSGFLTGTPGLYASFDDGYAFRRIRLRRANGELAFHPGVYFSRANCNLIDRRPQNAAGTLTDAQRPIYALDLGKAATGGAILYGELWRWKGGDILDPADWAMVKHWDAADIKGPTDTIGGDQAWLFVKVAPNGDVAVAGKKGVQLSTDEGGTWTSKYSAQSVRGFDFDYTASPTGTVTGALIAAMGAGVLKTANIRTTAFTKPAGQTGLPTVSFEPSSFNVCRHNFNKMFLTHIGKSGAGSYKPAGKVSTDGGVTFTNVASHTPRGSEDWRYGWGDRAPGMYPHPTKNALVYAMTQQTASHSDDGGANFHGDRCGYFDHAHAKGWGYDPNDPDRMAMMHQDGGGVLNKRGLRDNVFIGLHFNSAATNTAGASGTVGGFVQGIAGGEATRSGGKAAWPLKGTTRILYGMSLDPEHNKNVPVIASGTPYVFKVRTDVGFSRCAKSGYDPTNTFIYMGKWFVRNFTAAVESIPFVARTVGGINPEVLGWSHSGGTTEWIFGGAMNGGTTFYRSTTVDANGIPNTPSIWKTATSAFDNTACAVDRFNHQRVVFSPRTGNGKVYAMTAASAEPVLLKDLRPQIVAKLQAAGAPTTEMPTLSIEFIESDPNKSGLFYLCFNTPGTSVVMQSIDGGANWTDISLNLPHTNIWRIDIHRLTGELTANSSMGEYWLEAPPDYPSLTHKNRHTTFLRSFYDLDSIPHPIFLSVD